MRNGEVQKAADNWKKMNAKIEEYLAFCDKVNAGDPEEVKRIYGPIAAENMSHYTREWIDEKLKFMLGQLRDWSSKEAFLEFEKTV